MFIMNDCRSSVNFNLSNRSLYAEGSTRPTVFSPSTSLSSSSMLTSLRSVMFECKELVGSGADIFKALPLAAVVSSTA